jgi:phospholipid/cholesterol/gamma-HCH transport system permease protein
MVFICSLAGGFPLHIFTEMAPGVFELAGATVIGFFRWIGAITIFALRAILDTFRPPYEIRETMRQLYEVGWKSMPLIATSGFAVGAVLSMHTRSSLERFGAEALIPAGLAIAVVKETGPLTAGLLLAGRVGAGIGAELGGMRVTEQIDALESLAVDSFKFLVVTRVIACVIAFPLLTALIDFSAILGGYVAERIISGMSFLLYMDRAFSIIEFKDYIPPTLKTAVFGFIVSIVSCYLGVNTSGGTEGVGRASTRSVVLSSILLIAINVILVRMIFFLFTEATKMTEGAAIVLDRVSKYFGNRSVLREVSLEVPRSSAYSILGRSGTGKSVTLKQIIGLMKPDSGRIFVEDQEITSLNKTGLTEIRKRMGFLFQNAALFDSITVGENVAFPLRRHTRLSESEIRKRAQEKLALVGLEKEYAKMPDQLSGGMQKRAGLARALAMNPSILLVDEPSSGLDPITSAEIDDLLLEMKRTQGVTLVFVTHNIPSAQKIADCIVLLHEGSVIASGTARELEQNQNDFVQAFLQSNKGG